MTPHEALNYLTNIANDFLRTLPPTAAEPTARFANEAAATLARALEPAPVEPRGPRLVEPTAADA